MRVVIRYSELAKPLPDALPGSHHNDNQRRNRHGYPILSRTIESATSRSHRQSAKAEKAEWQRQIELRCEVRRLALNAVKAGIRARGDKLQLYSHAQLVRTWRMR